MLVAALLALMTILLTSFFFFFNDPAPPEISPLPLPAALPFFEFLAPLAGPELTLLYCGQPIELGVGVAAAQRFFAGMGGAGERHPAKPRDATAEPVG